MVRGAALQQICWLHRCAATQPRGSLCYCRQLCRVGTSQALRPRLPPALPCLLPSDPTHTNLHSHGLHDENGILSQLTPSSYTGECPPARRSMHPVRAPACRWQYGLRQCVDFCTLCLSPGACAGGDNIFQDVKPNGGQLYWRSELPRTHLPGEGNCLLILSG